MLFCFLIVKGAMQRDFDDLILASPIIQNFLGQTFFLLFSNKKCQNIYIKTTERKLF